MSGLERLSAVLYREAQLLDTQRWDDWLALYRADAEFWLPAWTDEHRLAASPETELSLMYCSARAGLEDRVWRLRSGLSVASTPPLRTVHSISNVLRVGAGTTGAAAWAELHSSWTCHVWNLKRQQQHVFFGRYEHRLRRQGDEWLIARKKVTLMNDRIPTMIDFYCV
ncbi:MAG: aromatic-ring-hydroxylating dioxygenase subunit beta [Burkholderiales bacterium]|nr:MAG: aromatic-ring-hydroxylating dioxygenase subunit beta [Burkholderiales bacterium]